MNYYEMITKAIRVITERTTDPLSFDELARSLEISTSHLRKIFVAWVGITPKQFHRYLSIEYAKQLLLQQKNSLQTTLGTGLSSGGRLHDLFVDIEAMTPGEFQKLGKNVIISYSAFETKFGHCLVASTDRGICNILFFDSPENGLVDLKKRWPKATIIHEVSPFHQTIKDYFSTLTPTSKIKLHLQGTNFQVKVWEALLSIPEGSVTTYGTIAKRIGFTGSAQAIGGAVGDNPVGYLIPCHRVLKSTGEMSGYRWGVERKRAMLFYESTKRDRRTKNEFIKKSPRARK